MKQIPEKFRPWIIGGWLVALYGWNLYSVWPADIASSDPNRIFLSALSLCLTPVNIFLSAAVIGACFIKWKW
jgi:hypothetical protein